MNPGDRVEVRDSLSGRVRLHGELERTTSSEAWVRPDGKGKARPFRLDLVRGVERSAPRAEELASRPQLERPMLKAQPRPSKPIRSRAYLRWVASQPCAICGSTKGIDAHHWAPTRGLSQKVNDTRAVPLCRSHHDEFHQRGRIGAMNDEQTRGKFLDLQVVMLEAAFVRMGNRLAELGGAS